jgi:hypothetical protein
METIVIVAIVVLVLVVIIAFFISGTAKPQCQLSRDAALARGCTDFAIRFNCQVDRLGEVLIGGAEGCEDLNTLDKACAASGYTDDAQCAQLACRCPG